MSCITFLAIFFTLLWVVASCNTPWQCMDWGNTCGPQKLLRRASKMKFCFVQRELPPKRILRDVSRESSDDFFVTDLCRYLRRSNLHLGDCCEIQAWKIIQGWTGFEPMTSDQLSYQANWELVTLWVHNITVVYSEEYRWIKCGVFVFKMWPATVYLHLAWQQHFVVDR